jgi:hypothetical protein
MPRSGMAPDTFTELADGFAIRGPLAIVGERVLIGGNDVARLIVQGSRDSRCERPGGENREPATCLVTVQFFGA